MTENKIHMIDLLIILRGLGIMNNDEARSFYIEFVERRLGKINE